MIQAFLWLHVDLVLLVIPFVPLFQVDQEDPEQHNIWFVLCLLILFIFGIHTAMPNNFIYIGI